MVAYVLILLNVGAYAFIDQNFEESWRYCFDTQEHYKIAQGSSFGSLMWTEYLDAECYRHFCERHPKSGKRFFECTPLKNEAPMTGMLRDMTGERRCTELKERYGVSPGVHFGSLPEELRNEYTNSKCNMLFLRHPTARDYIRGTQRRWLLNDEENKKFCFDVKETYNVFPGRSFGSLPRNMHQKYLDAKCYLHFCEPHPLGGRGVFKCIALPGVSLPAAPVRRKEAI